MIRQVCLKFYPRNMYCTMYMYTVSIGGPVSTLLEFYSIFSYSIHR